MNWWLSLALFGSVMWYIWLDNFPLMTPWQSSRSWQRKAEKVMLVVMIPMLAVAWGMA